ncbi:transposase [Streptomyces canus]
MPGVEGTINQALDITGIRRARYRGLPKVRLQHAFSATALNVIRLDAHWTTGPSTAPAPADSNDSATDSPPERIAQQSRCGLQNRRASRPPSASNPKW